MGVWAEEINSKIDINLEKSREKDLRFFRIDELKRNITRVDEFSVSCPFCNRSKIDIVETTDKIHEAVEFPGNSRREYDRFISRLSSHMQKEHGFFPPYYYSYWYSFIGILTGLIFGFFLYKIFPVYGETFLMASIIVGIIMAYITGSRKDNKIRSTKKIM